MRFELGRSAVGASRAGRLPAAGRRRRGLGARSRHVDAERPARVLVHHVRDRHGRDHFDEVGRDAAVQPTDALALDYLAEHAAHRALRAFRCFLC